MRFERRGRLAVVGLALVASVSAAQVAPADDEAQIARGIVPPAGFGHDFWSKVPLPTSLAWGPDDRLYVTSLDGSVYRIGQDRVPRAFASGLKQPLGVAVAPDGKVYVSDSAVGEGGLTWGHVKVFEDTDGDGAADSSRVVVDGLPNGRHNTNGLAFGPDGQLYVTNGSRTDDGVECGPPPLPVDCGNPGESQPLSGSLIEVDPDSRGVKASPAMVVSTGMRNVYDVAFWPGDRGVAYMSTNGPDDPAADDLLYTTRVDDSAVDDMGFPSCLYNAHENGAAGDVGGHREHGASLMPMDNPNKAVLERFGACPADAVKRPVAIFGGHVSADGLAFAHGSQFPGSYGNDLYVAEWGNMWGAEDGYIAGHKIARVNLRDDGTIVRDRDGMPSVTEFATGAAPIDLTFGPDGAMYVADNEGFIHRIAWTGANAPAADEADQAPPPDDGHGEGDNEETGECPAGTRQERSHQSGRTECEAFEAYGWRGTMDPATQDDDPNPSEGDRGWAWRLHDPEEDGHAGGHHDDDFDPGCSTSAVDELVDRMGRKLAVYDNDPWRAGADGYWMYPIAWKTYHMVNTSLYGDGKEIVPEHVESFMYAMTDSGLKAMGGMFTLDASWKDVPAEQLPGFHASNGEVCKMPWHAHTEEEGLATSFDPQNPTQSNWMAHVWVYGYDVWERGVDGTEASGWWWPYRTLPTFCNDDGGCL